MKISITGIRGIPNRYGGFEQFSTQLAVGLSRLGHDVMVYNPHYHSYGKGDYQGVKIIHMRSLEKTIGAGANYLYDLKCLKDAIRKNSDVILECGYASAAPWYPILRRGTTKLVTHMDGMEWQRGKWGRFTKKMMLRAEGTAIKHSDIILCDNPEIADYYRNTYSVNPVMIPYGAETREDWKEGVLIEMGLKPDSFYLLVARLEPENNIRMIIEGFLASTVKGSLVIVGDCSGKYGQSIFRKYGADNRLKFLGGVFDPSVLDHLRHYSAAVFHGHSAGGTNPSLLEAMAAGAFIIAHNNPCNKWVLGENAVYFHSADDLKQLVEKLHELEPSGKDMIHNNLDRINKDFQWDSIVRQYEELFIQLVEKPD